MKHGLLAYAGLARPYRLERTPAADGVHHNALGQRGRERTLQSLEGKLTIALFGASTTYEVDGSEGETWANVWRTCWTPTAWPSSIAACRDILPPSM